MSTPEREILFLKRQIKRLGVTSEEIKAFKYLSVITVRPETEAREDRRKVVWAGVKNNSFIEGNLSSNREPAKKCHQKAVKSRRLKICHRADIIWFFLAPPMQRHYTTLNNTISLLCSIALLAFPRVKSSQEVISECLCSAVTVRLTELLTERNC